jgi:hypothetical protein
VLEGHNVRVSLLSFALVDVLIYCIVLEILGKKQGLVEKEKSVVN